MKHIYRFGDKGYVHLDSYPERSETEPTNVQNFLLSLVVIAIATITAGALLGVDITDHKTWSRQDVHRTGR